MVKIITGIEIAVVAVAVVVVAVVAIIVGIHLEVIPHHLLLPRGRMPQDQREILVYH